MIPATKIETNGRCRVCGRTLKNPENAAAGIGPVCARKVAAAPELPFDVRAEFTVVRVTPEMVWITDESNKRGGKSVTNDAEGVVAWILAQSAYAGRRIVYRDSSGDWDELKHDGARFVGFAPAREYAP